MERLDENLANHPKYWMPLIWANSIITKCREDERIKTDFAMTTLIEKIDYFRGLNGTLLNYDWVPVPLVYTQVVTLAVYSFLSSTLFASQFLDTELKGKFPQVVGKTNELEISPKIWKWKIWESSYCFYQNLRKSFENTDISS